MRETEINENRKKKERKGTVHIWVVKAKTKKHSSNEWN